MKNLFSFLVLAMVLGCDSSSSGGQSFSPDPPLVIGGDERPADVDIPNDYDPEVSYPLVMLLHGAGADGATQAGYFQLTNFVDPKQFIMVYPDGTPNDEGRRLWNGAACCTADDEIDDVAYISGLIEEAQETYNIDSKRVYLIGHSNGGFMSFRMACEVPNLFTA
ncbi:MAG: alpha/beta hydrolase family esterase, partial [Polyangiales bacterium]